METATVDMPSTDNFATDNFTAAIESAGSEDHAEQSTSIRSNLENIINKSGRNQHTTTNSSTEKFKDDIDERQEALLRNRKSFRQRIMDRRLQIIGLIIAIIAIPVPIIAAVVARKGKGGGGGDSDSTTDRSQRDSLLACDVYKSSLLEKDISLDKSKCLDIDKVAFGQPQRGKWFKVIVPNSYTMFKTTACPTETDYTGQLRLRLYSLPLEYTKDESFTENDVDELIDKKLYTCLDGIQDSYDSSSCVTIAFQPIAFEYYLAFVDTIQEESVSFNIETSCGDVPSETPSLSPSSMPFTQKPSWSEQRQVLESLYENNGGSNWIDKDSWTSNAIDECYWEGILCINGTVTEIDLNKTALTGQIPTDIGSLLELQVLKLWNNQLTGTIPSEIGNLSQLQKLDLNGNNLTGKVPTEIGNLSNLMSLFLKTNTLTEQIPSEIGSLMKLEKIILADNTLTGPIPSEIGNVSSLKTLSFTKNTLNGILPTEVGNLTNLLSLSLSINSLTGPIPSEIGNLTKLVELSLQNNNLTGSIPTELGKLENLQKLYLSNIEVNDVAPFAVCALDVTYFDYQC